MDKPESLEELFAGRHFNRDVIILCVRWYLRFKLSLRDLAGSNETRCWYA
jgi:transposase-like protein